MDILALILALVFFIAGMIGTVLPLLPGPVLVFLGMLLYGLLTDFGELGLYFFILQSIVLAILFLADYFAPAIGTRLSGGSKQAAAGAVIGTVAALLAFGPLGLVIGPLAGAIVVELMRGAKFPAALRIGFGTLVGAVGGTLFKLGVELLMIAYFIIKIV